jgi:RNA polymerase sigma factor (sigma-70 family)
VDDRRSDLADLLAAHRDALRRFVEREGSGLLGRETVEDLVQGIHLQAIRVARRFEYRGEAEFLAWLRKVARQHIADRARYWRAMRRDAGNLLRVTAALSRSDGGRSRAVEIAATGTGPRTSAERRELIELATRALPALFPRDRDLVAWIAEDLPIEEMARRLGVSYGAAKQARRRAIERFRTVLKALARARRS